jgi:hypothetical protein
VVMHLISLIVTPRKAAEKGRKEQHKLRPRRDGTGNGDILPLCSPELRGISRSVFWFFRLGPAALAGQTCSCGG